MVLNGDSLKIYDGAVLTASPVLVSAVALAMQLTSFGCTSDSLPVVNLPTSCCICDSVAQPSVSERLAETQNGKLFSALNTKLKEFSELSHGWNGYDAAPIPSDVIVSARSFLQYLLDYRFDLTGWEVFPTGRETVQFEKTTKDSYVEVEVYSGERFGFYLEGKSELELDSIDFMETIQRVSDAFA